MNFSMESQLHGTSLCPVITLGVVRSFEYAHRPSRGFFSSIAHSISQISPLAPVELLLMSAMTPLERRIRVRTRSFHSELYGSLTDMSMNSKGERGCND